MILVFSKIPLFRPGRSRAVSLQCRRACVGESTQGLCHQPPFLSPLQLEALPYDERPLPAVHKPPAVAAVEPEKSDAEVSEAPRGGAVGEPEPLTEKALREAGAAVDVLGETLVNGAPRAREVARVGSSRIRPPRGGVTATVSCPRQSRPAP